MTRSLDDEERRSLLDALLEALAADDERRRAFCELLVPGVSELLPEPDGWLDSAAASRYLSIGRQALQRLARSGQILSHQGGSTTKRYYRRSELDAWRANRSAHGASDG